MLKLLAKFLVFLALSISPALASTDQAFLNIYPMVIKGQALPSELQHYPLDSLSLMAFRGKKLIPIPFQFDEFDQAGQLFLAGHSTQPIKGNEHYLDPWDELVFMMQDSGEKRLPYQLESMEVLHEIQIETPHTQRYVYIVFNNQNRSYQDYVSADLGSGTIDMPLLKIEYNVDDFTNLKSFQLTGWNSNTHDVIHSLRVDVSAGILFKNLRPYLKLSKHITAKPIGIRDGPVRATALLDVKAKWRGIPLYKTTISVNFYPYSINLPTRFVRESADTLKRFLFLLKQPRIQWALTLHGPTGSHFQFESDRLPGNWFFMQMNSPHHYSNLFFNNTLPPAKEGLISKLLTGSQFDFSIKQIEQQHHLFYGAFTGFPKEAYALNKAIESLKLSEARNLQEIFSKILDQADHSSIKKIDQIFEGTRQSAGVATLQHQIMADLNRIGLQGVARNQLPQLLKNLPNNSFSIVEIIEAIQNNAHINQIDLTKIFYQPLENTLWLIPSAYPFEPNQLSSQLIQGTNINVKNL